LAELDGFDPASGIVLLAATNRPEILDPALLRAGRFDRQVLVDRPDRKGCVQILQVHLRRVRLATDISVDSLAALTPGFSGADLANLVNEAALLATRRSHNAVSMEDFTAALERIVAGLEKRNRLLNPAERKTVAYHEMGHALAAMTLLPGETVHKVSIIPRGVGALGYTIQRPTEDRFLMTRNELRDKMTVLLAGRAAEQICLGEIPTGAAVPEAARLDRGFEPPGQRDAVESVRFAAAVRHSGFNLFVIGDASTGRLETTSSLLHAMAAQSPAPDDICYRNNFDDPARPLCLRRPDRRGAQQRGCALANAFGLLVRAGPKR